MISYKEALSLATGLELNSNKPIHGFAIDSRFCKPGYIFFAIKGANVDGHDFAKDALDNGAELIVCEREIKRIWRSTEISEKDQAGYHFL